MCRPARARRCCFVWPTSNNALVLGTGDLSELALGWCTYGVGDQMSHYNVNASVPKTLIQHLIRWCARDARFGAETVAVLRDILATEISPELVPGDGAAAQRTEDFVGPYALQDFNLFYATRYGFAPSKIAFLAFRAWRDAGEGVWPSAVPNDKRVAYDLPDDQALAWRVLAPLLRDQPIQTKRHAERSQGKFRRFAVAARRLASAERFLRRRLARRSGRHSLKRTRPCRESSNASFVVSRRALWRASPLERRAIYDLPGGWPRPPGPIASSESRLDDTRQGGIVSPLPRGLLF